MLPILVLSCIFPTHEIFWTQLLTLICLFWINQTQQKWKVSKRWSFQIWNLEHCISLREIEVYIASLKIPLRPLVWMLFSPSIRNHMSASTSTQGRNSSALKLDWKESLASLDKVRYNIAKAWVYLLYLAVFSPHQLCRIFAGCPSLAKGNFCNLKNQRQGLD